MKKRNGVILGGAKKLSPISAILSALLLCFGAHVASAGASDKIYAALQGDAAVAVVDPDSLDAWGEIKTGPAPAMLARAGDYVFVTENGGDSVRVIDAAKDVSVKSLKVGGQPYRVAATPDGRQVVVETLTGKVTIIGVSGLVELKQMDMPGEVYSLALSPDGSKAYAGGKEGKLWVIDLKQLKVTDELPIPQRVYYTAITASGDKLIVNSLEDSAVTVFSLPGMKVLKKLEAGSQGLVLSPDEGELWYGGPDGKVRVYSFKQDKVVADLPRDCEQVLEIVFSPDGKRAYVSPAGAGQHDIYVFDAAEKKRIGVVHLNEMPLGLLYIKQ